MKKLFYSSMLFSVLATPALLGDNVADREAAHYESARRETIRRELAHRETARRETAHRAKDSQYTDDAPVQTVAPDLAQPPSSNFRDKINLFNQRGAALAPSLQQQAQFLQKNQKGIDLAPPPQQKARAHQKNQKGAAIVPLPQQQARFLREDFFSIAKNDLLSAEFRKLNDKLHNATALKNAALYDIIVSSANPRASYLNGNTSEENYQMLARVLGKPIVVLDVRKSKNLLGLFPNFFISLTIYLPDGTSNVCLAGYIKDANVLAALCEFSLGPQLGLPADGTFQPRTAIQTPTKKSQWKNPEVTVPDWVGLWEQQQLLFFVNYDTQQFLFDHEPAM
jgi:hypothetical protein